LKTQIQTLTTSNSELTAVITDLQGQVSEDAAIIEGLQNTIIEQQLEIERLKKLLESDPGPNVLFETGFEPPVSISPYPYKITGLDNLLNLPGVDEFVFNISPAAYTIAAIRKDPTNPNNNCLYGQVIADDPSVGGTSRFQSSLRLSEEWKTFHVQYRMYLSPDIKRLENYSGLMDWFTLMEMWERRNTALDGDSQGQTRWIFGLYKPSGTGPLRWEMDAIYMQPATLQNKHVWRDSLGNPTFKLSDVPVPYGKWFTLDFLLVRGQAENGHILISIQPDGEEKQVLFDIHDFTERPDTPLPIWAWNIFKLYADTRYVSYITQSGGKLYVYYDNFKVLER